MRRHLSAFLICAIMLSFSGCNNMPQSATTNPSISVPTDIEENTTPTVSTEDQQQPMYAVSLIPQVDETTDESGRTRFRYSYQNLSLVLPEAEVADRIFLDYLNKMDQAENYAATVRAESLSEVYDTLPHLPLFYQISYTPARFDASILSLYANEIVYLGGVHPDYIGNFTTYDLLTGKELKLSEVLTDSTTIEYIVNQVIVHLAEYENLWENYQDIIKDLFKVGLEKYEYWYFTETGLCFHFDPYVLAAFATGPIAVEIPYTDLIGILKDEFFPAETDFYHGSIHAESFTVEALEDFTQFAEIVLNENGTKILLVPDGAVSNITIKTVKNTETESNLSETTVMTVQTLTPGDAIMVEFDPSSTKILVSYRSGDQIISKTVNYSRDQINLS